MHRTPPADPQLAALAAADARDGEWVITLTGYVAYWVLERAAIVETGAGLSRREALALVAREVAARALPVG